MARCQWIEYLGTYVKATINIDHVNSFCKRYCFGWELRSIPYLNCGQIDIELVTTFGMNGNTYFVGTTLI